jgi:hypothetical protein
MTAELRAVTRQDRPRSVSTDRRGRRRRCHGIVKVAIVGVGNCAASLVQGVEYYRDADETTSVPGLMHVRFGDYHVSDVSSSPRSTSTPRRSAATSPRPSSPARTTPSRSATSRRWA